MTVITTAVRPGRARTALRGAVSAALLASGAGLVGGAAPASAEEPTNQRASARDWTPMASVHGAATEGCVKAAPGESGAHWKLLVRGDNRAGDHTHLFGVTVYDDDSLEDPVRSWDGRARAGKTTKVVRIKVREADDVLSAGIGEVTGEGLGGTVDLTVISRC